MGVRVLGQEIGVDHLVLRPRDGAKNRARLVLAGNREVVFAQDLLHERLLVVRVVDDEVRVEADSRAVAAQDSRAQGMESAHRDFVAGLLPDQACDPGTQLRRGLVGEGDGQNLPWPDALDPDEIGDSMGEDARLAAAGAGQDQHRTLRGSDRPLLLRVEAGQYPRRQRLGGGLTLGQGHRLGLERGRLHGFDARSIEGLGRGLFRNRRQLVERRAQLRRTARKGRLGIRIEAVRVSAGLAAFRPGV